MQWIETEENGNRNDDENKIEMKNTSLHLALYHAVRAGHSTAQTHQDGQLRKKENVSMFATVHVFKRFEKSQ